MKFLPLLALWVIAFPAYSVEFYKCVDTDGKSHFTNLPRNSLDRNCVQKTNLYALMLDEDYQNLNMESRKYEQGDNDESQLEEIKQQLDGMVEPDKSDELLKNTQNKPGNTATLETDKLSSSTTR